MPIVSEKIQETALEPEAIECYLREKVVKTYDAVKEGRSTGKPLEQSRMNVLAALRATRIRKSA
jgi:hypothetical protein